MPAELKVIDPMLNVPGRGGSDWYASLLPLLMDRESREMMAMPAEYMFRDIPDLDRVDDCIAYTIEQMDRHNIERAMLALDYAGETAREALKRHPERFFAACSVNPNGGREEVERIEQLHRDCGIRAVTAMASAISPQIPYNDSRWYPVYAKLVELDLVFCPCVGVPGPRVPMHAQKVEWLDEVCWLFPELRVVMTHGAEPWEELACKLMLKYPNLHYMTSAFAPRHYPKAIVDFANTRGADKILYAGYFPMGLSLERIFRELPAVPFREAVWPKFLRENAIRVFKLED